MHKLKIYIKQEEKSQQEFSRILGVTPNTLSSLIKGKSMPSLKLAYKIEKATGGLVTLYDWIPEDEKKYEPKKEKKQR